MTEFIRIIITVASTVAIAAWKDIPGGGVDSAEGLVKELPTTPQCTVPDFVADNEAFEAAEFFELSKCIGLGTRRRRRCNRPVTDLLTVTGEK